MYYKELDSLLKNPYYEWLPGGKGRGNREVEK